MTEKEFFERYAPRLSDQQKEAVQRVDGQTLLLAVPGSGKTTVLVTRLGYMLLVKGVRPSEILTITYTVAATKDMAKRFTGVFGEEAADGLEFRTINGICAKVIMEYGRKIGKDSYALQTDESVLQKAVKDILAEHMEEYPGESDIKTARTLITYCKNMMLAKDAVDKLGEKENLPLWDILGEYNSWLRSNGMMDYDDQMVYAYAILSRSQEMLTLYRDRFRYINVDEAQDTSKIQHELVRLLIGDKGNLFMVGDEDQSIYGFRAAYPEALLRFTDQHPEGVVLVMDRNFRSGQRIVELSDAVISNNRERHEKHMQANRDITGSVSLIRSEARLSQYRIFAEKAAGSGVQTAILCRENESLVPFVDLLDRRKIPFAIKGADISFFTGRIASDVTSIMEFAKNPDDTGLFMRIYYKCRLYLKKNEAETACREASGTKKHLKDVLQDMPLFGRTKKACSDFFKELKNLISEPPRRALSRITGPIGYGDYLSRLGIKGDKLFVMRAIAAGEGTVNGFMNRMRYLRELMGEGHGNGNEDIILSTVHSSKGLEYNRVFLADVCDGVFPSPGSEDMEEERRLFYVGMTRAREDLCIFEYGDYPSCFVQELKEGMGRAKKNAGKASVAAAAGIRPEPGMKVHQQRYGDGVVTGVEHMDGNTGRFTVRFGEEEKCFSYPMAFEKGLTVTG